MLLSFLFFFSYGSLSYAELFQQILCCNLNPDALANPCMPQSSDEGTMRRLCCACCGWKGVVLAW